MKKTFLFILAVLLPVVASAYDAVINNIAYDFDQIERTATVTMGSIPPSAVYIPATVTYNGEEYWVTGIASKAFYGSNDINWVTIGPNVTSIGSQAFASCSNLYSVTLLNFNIFEIWESVFSDYHYSSTTLYVPKGFKDAYEDWGWDRFQKMVETDRALAAVKMGSIYYNLIPELNMAEVTNSRGGVFGTQAVYSGSVNIPSSVTYDGIQCNVTSIGESAFYSCGALTSVILPGSVTSIGKFAFNYCMKLSSIEIPNSVKRIGSQAFYSCASLTSISLPNVVSIGEAAFQNCTGMTWFTIPWAVTTIKNNTFYGCTSLTFVGIHDRVTSIGRNAFSDCSSLESVTIPKSVTSIGDYAFYNCSNLTSVTSLITNPFAINDNVFAGKDYSFTSATLYVHMDLKWDYWSTSGWNNFKNVEVYIPKIDGIYYYLSLGTKEATVTNRTGGGSDGGGSYSGKVTIPATINFDGEEYTVTNIGDRAFYECSELTSVTIPDGVKSIGEYAFYRCGTLTSVILPGSVTSIGNSAFAYCSKLESITIPDSMTSIGGHAFEGCSSLISITIPDGVTSIEEGTFYDCTGLTSVNMGNSVTSIGEIAFTGCSKLTSIVIPGSVTSIGNSAFVDCGSLSVVTSLIADPFEITEEVFDNSVYTSATLYVPKGTKAKYEAIPAWNMFQKIEEIVVKGDVNDDGAVDVADIATIIDVMAGKAPEYKDKADVNNDKTVDVADIAIIIDIMAGKDVDTPEEQAYTVCPDDHHPHWIDLGLPSGTKWACCNVGASTPEGYGNYYAWGETQTKDVYNWSTYIHYDGSMETCHDIGSDIAGTDYDAATANWGAPWRMPSKTQIDELLDYTTNVWTIQNGVNGRKFTGSNGGTVFLPAAGYVWDGGLSSVGSYGLYWSSTPLDESGGDELYFDSGTAYWSYGYGSRRYVGSSVRPVR